MYCPNCRNKIDNNFKFCPACAYQIPDISLLKRKSTDSIPEKVDLKTFIIVTVISLILIIFSIAHDLQKNKLNKPTVNAEASKKEQDKFIKEELAKIEKKSISQKHKTAKTQTKKTNKPLNRTIQHKKTKQSKPIVKVSKKSDYIKSNKNEIKTKEVEEEFLSE